MRFRKAAGSREVIAPWEFNYTSPFGKSYLSCFILTSGVANHHLGCAANRLKRAGEPRRFIPHNHYDGKHGSPNFEDVTFFARIALRTFLPLHGISVPSAGTCLLYTSRCV